MRGFLLTQKLLGHSDVVDGLGDSEWRCYEHNTANGAFEQCSWSFSATNAYKCFSYVCSCKPDREPLF
ncbi:hypothetical protein Y032_0080g1365 [Ancylostoma ceylanicum]|uniref:Uncharacterized protein n=1 Tax=Ancylostoma ceylanicum TaxID=53326 RepID=A0A016TSQ9_9BILA|nr:hypothetical protein Y032_0080g1365 [Ancylostoma ceylanicum]